MSTLFWMIAAQFAASTSLLLFASLGWKVSLPLGMVDGVLAFTLVGSVWRFRSTQQFKGLPSAYLHTIPAVIAMAIWWQLPRLELNILLPGVAWRVFALQQWLEDRAPTP